jgi:two-component system nitrogen regulation response regulator NtrX
VEKPKLLAIDDAPEFLNALRLVLQDDYEIVTATTSRDGLEMLRRSAFDAVLLDLHLSPEENGLETLAQITGQESAPPVVMITGDREATVAVEALTRKGAYDYIIKPPDRDRLVTTVRNAVNKSLLERERIQLLEYARKQHNLVGNSAQLKKVREMAQRIGPSELPVLITGESGTGKEIVAKLIHCSSRRIAGELIPINMAALPDELAESELFGYVKGAFTGAIADKDGLFEMAQGGTVFLDEIGIASLRVQSKILRAVETKQFYKVGGTKIVTLDVRVISATSRKLETEMEHGNFLPDLYHRLNGFRIHVPPLRERPEDIIAIAEHLMRHLASKRGEKLRTLSPDARMALLSCAWPGNVRDLQYIVECILEFYDSEEIGAEDVREQLDLKFSNAKSQPSSDFKRAREDWERDYLLKSLAAHNYVVSDTAHAIGLHRVYLHKKLKSLGIETKLNSLGIEAEHL